jgi:tetratricopeptide (TPR) repeat protein
VVLLFLILLEMSGELWRSAFVAALFAIHPLRVESVAWISERKDVLSGFFFMLTLGAYLIHVRRPGVGRYLAVILLFAIGLMCKPMIVTLPFVLLLLDYWPLERLFSSPASKSTVNWRVVLEKVPMLVLSIALCAATMMGPKDAWIIEAERIPFWTRMAEAPVWLATYLVQMIWPAGLAVVYTHYEGALRWFPTAVAWMGALTLGFALLRRKHPYLWMGWLWNLVMLLPVLGFVQISRHARADHYTYLPQIGLYIGLTWFAADWAEKRPQRRLVLGGAAVVALTLLTFAAWRQTAVWHDSVTLWNHTIECTRDNYIARANLGATYFRAGQIPEAIEQYQEAVKINPDQMDAQYSLGLALFQEGVTEEAITHYRAALQADPDNADAHTALGNALVQEGRLVEALAEYGEAARIDPTDAQAQYNLAVALYREGRMEEAIDHFRAALQIEPTSEAAHDNLGNALFQTGRLDEAIAQYRAVLQINPANANAENNLGSALLRQGNAAEAIQHFKKALDLKPGNVAILNNLASVLATAPQPSLRDGAKAVQFAMQARKAGGDNPNLLRTLAAAYAQAGKYQDAVQTAQDALRLAQTAELADTLRRDIKLYETGHPADGQ